MRIAFAWLGLIFIFPRAAPAAGVEPRAAALIKEIARSGEDQPDFGWEPPVPERLGIPKKFFARAIFVERTGSMRVAMVGFEDGGRKPAFLAFLSEYYAPGGGVTNVFWVLKPDGSIKNLLNRYASDSQGREIKGTSTYSSLSAAKQREAFERELDFWRKEDRGKFDVEKPL